MRLIALSLVILPLLGSGFEYREALPGYPYQFPRDHFEHQDFRTEWWYYTGNVTAAGGERYGFELVFFREGAHGSNDSKAADTKSAWNVQNLYLAHAALTDAKGKRFGYEERLNRQGPGVAGASFDRHRIWNGNWSSQWAGEDQTLDAITEHFRFHLQLKPEKPFVIQGENGVSQKAEGQGRASHYVSFPRLAVSGTINSHGVNQSVSGSAWMDHEWFTEHASLRIRSGWDWFSVQLDNHTELMLFELRRQDGSIDPFSSGTFIDAHGVAETSAPRSVHSAAIVLLAQIPRRVAAARAAALNIDLTSRAVLPDQELRGSQSYWEGAVDYSGTQRGSRLHIRNDRILRTS